jgi:hypothetical protein
MDATLLAVRDGKYADCMTTLDKAVFQTPNSR